MKKLKTSLFSFHCTKILKEKIMREAKKSGVSASEYIRDMFEKRELVSCLTDATALHSAVKVSLEKAVEEFDKYIGSLGK